MLPNGCFFRAGAELAVRKDLIDADLVEAIVQLPVDLFYGADPRLRPCLNRRRPTDRTRARPDHRHSVGFERRDTKNVLTGAAIRARGRAFIDGAEEDGVSQLGGDRRDVAGQDTT